MLKLFILDIDGTLTDGMLTYDHMGNVSKSYYTRDCAALHYLRDSYNISLLAATCSNNKCDAIRMEHLRIPLLARVDNKDKSVWITEWIEKRKYSWNEVAYIGDSMNDFGCLEKASWAACPADAEDYIKTIVNFVSSKNGGRGAIEEFIEFLKKNVLTK